MHGMHAITDMHRIAMLEAQSARPNAPQRPDKGPRQSRFVAIRLVATRTLRRIADILEPTATPAPATTSQGSCT